MGICIVVPVFNVEKYLPQCIESLLNQTVKIDQLVLVDDGSTDACPQICDRYAERVDSIVAVHKNNDGLGMARNTGIEYCNQEYISFFDSDDFADPDYVEHLIAPINAGFDTCKSSYRIVDMEGRFIRDEKIISGTFENEIVKKELLPQLIGSAPNKKDSIPMSSCGTIYSMQIINENSLRFVSERDWISEDVIFNIKYYSNAKRVKITEYIGYNYRVNPKSLTKKYMPNRFEKCKSMYVKEQELLSELDLYGLCKYRLDRQFFNYLRMCFAQLAKPVSGLGTREIIRHINYICSDEMVGSIVKEYPVKELGFKQSVFLLLVKNKMATILYMFFIKLRVH